MSRWKAVAIHFSISLVAFALVLAVILVAWYPGILFSVDGGWTGLRIVAGVDLVLGPLLTLVVFKTGKPGLKFDLSCIAIAQSVCMAIGIWIVYNERPVALVLAYDTFYSLATQEFDDFGRDVAVLDSFPGRAPKLLFTELPANDVSADIENVRSQFIGDPLYIQTDKYRAIPQDEADLKLVFRREQSVRASVSEEFLAALPANCILSKFISAVTSGYVCYDQAAGKLSEYFANEYAGEEGEPI